MRVALVVLLLTSKYSFQVKSMAQYLDMADKLFFARKERFPDRFSDDINDLVKAVTQEIVSKQDAVSLKEMK